MATQVEPASALDRSLADLIAELGDIPLERIRAVPPPGTATETDVMALRDRTGRLCELVDGVLVEKAMGFSEAFLASELARLLGNFVAAADLGITLAEGGTTRYRPGLVRIPDACYVSWERLPSRSLPAEAIPSLVPDLVVEVLSPSDTRSEMRRKLREYFAAGVRLVWYIDPQTRTAEVFTGPNERTVIDEGGILDGGDVLPGFQLKLGDLLARVPEL